MGFRRRRRWGGARDSRCGHVLIAAGKDRPHWKKTPASAASPRARLCRRCWSGGRCITRTNGRTHRSCKTRNHLWGGGGRGRAPAHRRPWLTLYLPMRMHDLVRPEKVWKVRGDRNMVVSHRKTCCQPYGQQELQVAKEGRKKHKKQFE